MARLTYAAQTLIDQVQALYPNVEITYGEPDGLDVIREITIDRKVGKEIWPALSADLDRRIENGKLARQGGLVLTFSHLSLIADQRGPFDLSSVDAEPATEETGDNGSGEAESNSGESSEEAK